jgi:class 3 adenylate cyclase
MVFSLQKRFLVFLLVPVATILVAVGIGGFLFARSFLVEQWTATTNAKLEKAVFQIQSKLSEKIQLVELVARAGEIPSSRITQTFLIQYIAEQKGVKFVDVVPVPTKSDRMTRSPQVMEEYRAKLTEGLYTMELCDDFGFCAPIMDPAALDRSLRIVKLLPGRGDGPGRQLIARIAFASFLEPIKTMDLWPGSTAVLVTSTGQFLTTTDRDQFDRRRLGEFGDSFEEKILDRIRTAAFGTVFGEGHPPDRIAAFHKVPIINWYLLVISDGKEILRPIVSFRFYYAVAVAVLIAVILLLIRQTTGSVVTSISRISAAAENVKQGNYDVKLPDSDTNEIGILMRNMNSMAEGLKQRDLIERTFGRYVDREVANELMKRPEALRMGGELKTVSIMMADLRNFTAVSERLSPEQVITVLNRYFAQMIDVVQKYRGIIVDFYGDSILVFFDGVESDVRARALDSVHCALEMQTEIEEFVRERTALGLPELRMGVGIHTGEVVVGNIGTESRAKYGIVGSNVNLTARIQATASGGKVVISEQTRDMLGELVTVDADFGVCLKGVGGDKQLYEVAALKSDPETRTSPAMTDVEPQAGEAAGDREG